MVLCLEYWIIILALYIWIMIILFLWILQHLILHIILIAIYNNVQHVFMALGNDRRTIFTHGAWSDSHGVLGVIDDMNTLYFIKSNGEEITRITKRQLKTPAQIIVLIVREDLDAKSSYLWVSIFPLFLYKQMTSVEAFQALKIGILMPIVWERVLLVMINLSCSVNVEWFYKLLWFYFLASN